MNRLSSLLTAVALGLGSVGFAAAPAQADQCRHINGARVCGDGDGYSIDWPDRPCRNCGCGSGARRWGVIYLADSPNDQNMCEANLHP